MTHTHTHMYVISATHKERSVLYSSCISTTQGDVGLKGLAGPPGIPGQRVRKV